MPGVEFLPGTRNLAPLTQQEINRATSTFLGLDSDVPFRYEAGQATRFRIVAAQGGEEEYAEIVFSDDLYPGHNIANPNASLSMRAAVAHEIAHYYRWRDKRELDGADMQHLDEALTSLDAAQAFAGELSDNELQQLIADAMERLRLHIQQLGEPEPPAAAA
jgi:hypothetical protein